MNACLAQITSQNVLHFFIGLDVTIVVAVIAYFAFKPFKKRVSR